MGKLTSDLCHQLLRPWSHWRVPQHELQPAAKPYAAINWGSESMHHFPPRHLSCSISPVSELIWRVHVEVFIQGLPPSFVDPNCVWYKSSLWKVMNRGGWQTLVDRCITLISQCIIFKMSRKQENLKLSPGGVEGYHLSNSLKMQIHCFLFHNFKHVYAIIRAKVFLKNGFFNSWVSWNSENWQSAHKYLKESCLVHAEAAFALSKMI